MYSCFYRKTNLHLYVFASLYIHMSIYLLCISIYSYFYAITLQLYVFIFLYNYFASPKYSYFYMSHYFKILMDRISRYSYLAGYQIQNLTYQLSDGCSDTKAGYTTMTGYPANPFI